MSLERLLEPILDGTQPLVPCDDETCPAEHVFDSLINGHRAHSLADHPGWPTIPSGLEVLCVRCGARRRLDSECTGCHARVRQEAGGTDVWRMDLRRLNLWRMRTRGEGPTAWCQLHRMSPNLVSMPVLIEGTEIVFREYLLRDGKKYLDREYGGAASVPRRIRLLASPPPYALELMT